VLSNSRVAYHRVRLGGVLLACLGAVAIAAPAPSAAVPQPTYPALAILSGSNFIPVSVTGSGFGTGAESTLEVQDSATTLSIAGTTTCGGTVVHTCIVRWADDWVIAKLPTSMTQARLRIVAGVCPANCSEYIRAQYYTYDYAKTRTSMNELANTPLAIATDPDDPLHRVWLNDEHHDRFKVLTPGQSATADLPLSHPPMQPPFYTGYLGVPVQSNVSSAGEDTMIDPHGRVWFTEGGWGPPDGYWNTSRVVMYRYDIGNPAVIAESRVYTIPGHSPGVLSLAYEQDYLPGKDRVWYSVHALKPFFTLIPARIGWFDPDEPGLAHDGTREFTTSTCVPFSCTDGSGAHCCADNTTRRCSIDLHCTLSNQVCYNDAPPNPSCAFHEYQLPAVTFEPGHIARDADGAIWYADYWGGSNLGRLDPVTGVTTLYPLGDDPNRGPQWLLGSAPWELQIAANDDIIVNEYSDLTINRFDITRVGDAACETLVGLQNPCVISVNVPGPATGYAQHTVYLDRAENVWFDTNSGQNADPTAVATAGYVKRDWKAAVLFPPLTLLPMAPGELVAGGACTNPNDPNDPFRGFHGAGVSVDYATDDIWFADFCRERLSRLKPTVTDIALARSATQSSDDSASTTADKAVDGNVDGNLVAGLSVSRTASEAQPWWQVDLAGSYPIQEIELWNRTDCCSTDLQDFYVFVSDVQFVSTDPAVVQSQEGVLAIHQQAAVGTRIAFAIGRTGRYVRVQRAGTGALALAEVVVLGGRCTSNGACNDNLQCTGDLCNAAGAGDCSHTCNVGGVCVIGQSCGGTCQNVASDCLCVQN
jgi:hypothetical protein